MAAVGELIPSDEVQNGPDGVWHPASKIPELHFGSTTRQAKPAKQSVTPLIRYVYKMVQIPPQITFHQDEDEPLKGNEAAVYLEGVVNKYALEGWEFFRVDTVGVKVMPGCLGLLLGKREETILYYVVSFRKAAERSAEQR